MCFEILFFTSPNSFYLGSHSFKKNHIDKMWLFNLCGKDCGLSLNHDFLFGFLSFNALWFVAFAKAKFITLFLPSFFRKFFLHAKKKLFHYFLFLIFASLNFFFTANIMKKRSFFVSNFSHICCKNVARKIFFSNFPFSLGLKNYSYPVVYNYK